MGKDDRQIKLDQAALWYAKASEEVEHTKEMQKFWKREQNFWRREMEKYQNDQ